MADDAAEIANRTSYETFREDIQLFRDVAKRPQKMFTQSTIPRPPAAWNFFTIRGADDPRIRKKMLLISPMKLIAMAPDTRLEAANRSRSSDTADAPQKRDSGDHDCLVVHPQMGMVMVACRKRGSDRRQRCLLSQCDTKPDEYLIL
jgi:hypothetical protein